VTQWRWIGGTLVHAIHDRQLAEHGGLPGIRDAGAIESALACPRNHDAYGEADAASLAAAYAYGLARNHGFLDGNKRTAWVTARLFLADHAHRLAFRPLDAITTMQALADGTITEPDLATWFRERLSGPSG
jgi:death-on-curing protein